MGYPPVVQVMSTESVDVAATVVVVDAAWAIGAGAARATLAIRVERARRMVVFILKERR